MFLIVLEMALVAFMGIGLKAARFSDRIRQFFQSFVVNYL
jgi:hypothetical protein